MNETLRTHKYKSFVLSAAKQTSDPEQQLLLAARAGAARELYEETGLDMMRQLHRLEPAPLQPRSNGLVNLYKSRLFFHLSVTDADFPTTGNGGVTPMTSILGAPSSGQPQHLQLKLSVEHAGFCFQPEPSVAIEMLQHHSGGKCSEALRLAQQQREGGDTATAVSSKPTDSADLLPPPSQKESNDCCGCFGSSS